MRPMPAIKGAPVPANQGESNGQAVLTWEEVRVIRSDYAAGGVTQRALAARHGVSQRSIQFILRNINWHDPEYTPLPQHR